MSAPPTRLRVLVLHNSDFGTNSDQPDDPQFSSRVAVENAAHAVADALTACGHEASVQGVDFPGIDSALLAMAAAPPEIVFNLCESLRGDARHELVVPALLDLAGIPYTGSPALALGLALRKDRAKALLRERGVPTPEAVILRDNDIAPCQLPFPLIVKPTREDASVGISNDSVVHDRRALRVAVGRVIEELRQPALVERFIEGRELYVSLLGNEPALALPMHEIDFSDLPAGLHRIVSYEGKWVESSAEFHGTKPMRCILDDDVRRNVEGVARAAFDALELRDYGRVDIRLSSDNTPYVIDVNPNCDLSDGAGFARAAGYGGYTYAALIEKVCLIALERTREPVRKRSRRKVVPAVVAGAAPASTARRSRAAR